MTEYWFNLSTKQVEEGRQSSNMERMGPYSTREEAAAALETAQQRNEAADEAEERWREAWNDDDHDAEPMFERDEW